MKYFSSREVGIFSVEISFVHSREEPRIIHGSPSYHAAFKFIVWVQGFLDHFMSGKSAVYGEVEIWQVLLELIDPFVFEGRNVPVFFGVESL